MGIFKSAFSWTTLFLLAVLNAGCGGPAPTPESLLFTKSKLPDIRGEITSMTIREETIRGIHVEGEIQPDTRLDKAVASLSDRTRIYAATTDGYELVTRENLQVGQMVEVLFFMDTVLERDPVIGEAEEIVILP